MIPVLPSRRRARAAPGARPSGVERIARMVPPGTPRLRCKACGCVLPAWGGGRGAYVATTEAVGRMVRISLAWSRRRGLVVRCPGCGGARRVFGIH